MKKTNAIGFKLQRHLSPLIGLLFVCLLLSPARVRAPEEPPGCNGGLGNTSWGSLSFPVAQAHVGDIVPFYASLGMVAGACKAINATGSVWIATGRLTNFLVNVTLDPGALVFCPNDPLCRPGPYQLLITPALVGAGVNTPNGSIAGVPKAVRAVQNGEGTVLTGAMPELLADFHTRTIAIVTPCVQVVKHCAYPAGASCFPTDAPIQFTGYVTNCGDIQLTNVTVGDNRSTQLLTANGLPLSQPLTLNPGEAVGFQGSFPPTLQETATGSATNALTATAQDTTVIGGPNAAVTNSTTGACAICINPFLVAPTYTGDGQFQFNVAGRAGSNYVIQVSTNLGLANWLSLQTNAAPFTFVDPNAGLYPARFYRAVFLP